MTDLFGFEPAKAAFRDIRNQRDSVAEEKARLCLELNKLCNKVPERIRNADIRLTREWVSALERARKVLGSKRSSVAELKSELENMQSYA